MTYYSEMKQTFRELKRTSPRDNLTDHVIFTENSFARHYLLLICTYCVSSRNNGFWPGLISRSIFTCCLDKTSDQGVRLDWYMAEEGNPNGWKVDDCYIWEQIRDAEAMSDLTRIEVENETICYGFRGTCIRVLETAENGIVHLEPLAGNQTMNGEWVDLSIDRVCGYCTLLERHLNGSAES